MTAVAVKGQARDLEADLAICEAATPGPWNKEGSEVWRRGTGYTDSEDGHKWICDAFKAENAQLIAAAREGWPYAIRRAMEAEAEVDRLRNELQMAYERISYLRGLYD
ncbi:hypothetical protein COLU111180_06365 [Cohnella lubricantis]|uniref:Uncharacterized protein n=1 Tax=Cohnella lubricantis TaxID=2163172 RepID=A0A841TEU2_9BACL|nr:hypothetical protein [Cohnella lubricantis]MBB6677497.1 hypothetical protein [Cohnella lubricantis]MBP2116617.1 hypothetical protein [Cohnella lubricantis]